jgi:hypothetical protein
VSGRVTAAPWHPGTVCPRTGERPDTVTCGACQRAWCGTCDPCPAASCPWCHGYGYSVAPIERAPVSWADGFGVWHTVVSVGPRERARARGAILAELSARAPRGARVAVTVERVPYGYRDNATRVEYVESVPA